VLIELASQVVQSTFSNSLDTQIELNGFVDCSQSLLYDMNTIVNASNRYKPFESFKYNYDIQKWTLNFESQLSKFERK
jgi:hypothetical protein